MHIAWKLAGHSVNVASVRYRAFLPARNLELKGVRSRFYSRSDWVDFYDRPDAVVFVKTFSPHDLQVARVAHGLGIPVYLDLCDNIFFSVIRDRDRIVSNLIGKCEDSVTVFRKMAALSRAIVVTGPELATIVRREVPEFQGEIRIIPDGIETPTDLEWGKNITAGYRRDFLFGHGKWWFFRFAFPWMIYRAQLLLQQVFERISWRLFPRGTPGCSARAFGFFGSLTRLGSVPGLIREVEDVLRAAYLPATSEKKGAASEAKLVSSDPVVLWFGNGGIPGIFGITDLLEIAPHLETVAKTNPFTLVCISDDISKYDDYIAKLPIRSKFVQWRPDGVIDWIKRAKVVIIPNPKNEFTLCKSSNRAILALENGTPVVATRTAALEPLSGSVVFDDWVGGVRSYLVDPDRSRRDSESGRKVIEREYAGERIASCWAEVLQGSPGRVEKSSQTFLNDLIDRA